MAVITISSELGSGGFDIGQRVAQNLGYEFVDKNTSDRVFRQYGLTKFDKCTTRRRASSTCSIPITCSSFRC